MLLDVYFDLCNSDDEIVRFNAAKNFPCMFMMFAKNESNLEYLIKTMSSFCRPSQSPKISCLTGKFYHDVLQMAVNYSDPFETFTTPLINLLENSAFDVKVSCLSKLGSILNIFNRYFKNKIQINESNSYDKFSQKDCRKP